MPPRGGVLIVSNHQGNLDPVLLGVHMGRPLSYLAKSELFEVSPGLTWLLRALGGIPVKLGVGDVGAVKQMIQRLREGHALTIYPEGNRTEDGEIAPLQKGVALVVRRARVPVVPAVIVGSFEAWPRQRTIFRCHPVWVRYGPPIHLSGTDDDQIVTVIDHTLRRMFDELRAQTNSAAHSCNPSGRVGNE